MKQIFRTSTIEVSNKTIAGDGASEIEFINKGNLCKIMDVSLDYNESISFTTPFFGTKDTTKYVLTFETNNSLDNKLIIIRTFHTN